MAFEMVELNELMAKKNGSLNPIKYPDETFELHSIPSFDEGYPEILLGSQIGSSKQIVQENDVMISKIVPHIRRAMVVPKKSDYRQIASGEWIVFRSEMFFPNYLKHLLITDLFNKQFMATVSGVGGSLMRARPSSVAQIKIPLPPLQTQIHIAQVLDKVDELRQKRKKAIKKLDELLKATFIKMFGDPVTNPMGWDIIKLTKIADYFNGLTYKPEHIDNNGVIVLRSSNIQDSSLDFKDIVRVNTKIKEKIFVKDNDILMCSRNGSARLVGKVALIKNLTEPMTFGAFMMIIRSQEKYTHYLMNYFQNIAFRRQIATGATTTINQITSAMLDRVSLPLPSDELLEKFTQIATQIEQQKAKLQTQLDELETLFLALQQRAFSGEL